MISHDPTLSHFIPNSLLKYILLLSLSADCMEQWGGDEEVYFMTLNIFNNL